MPSGRAGQCHCEGCIYRQYRYRRCRYRQYGYVYRQYRYRRCRYRQCRYRQYRYKAGVRVPVVQVGGSHKQRTQPNLWIGVGGGVPALGGVLGMGRGMGGGMGRSRGRGRGTE